jgi:predicted nucleic-acid-binding Zn-ribbon protein
LREVLGMVVSKEKLEQEFVCPKCRGRGALAQEVSLAGPITRMLPLAPHRYLAVTCGLCGYTELYLTAILEKEAEEVPAMAKLAEKPKS